MSKAKSKNTNSKVETPGLETAQSISSEKFHVEDDPKEEDEDDEEPETTSAQKDKKKKKKKKGNEKKETSSSVPISAAGRAILERQKLLAEEEARIKILKEAEEKRIREEEEKEAARLQAIEEEKERKKKAKADKIERQKAAGTYMTKAEKEKHKKLQARLESLKISGNVPALKEKSSDSLATESTEGAGSLSNPSFPPSIHSQSLTHNEISSDSENIPEGGGGGNEEGEEEEDWEVNTTALLDAAKSRVSGITPPSAPSVVEGDEDDLLSKEKREEQSRLRLAGLDRIRREEEARLKREAEERERAELEKKEREAAMRKENARLRRKARDETALAARSPDRLRSAISVIMGHVDTGKTKLLDKIRHTNVQEGEAGGITQQIGATQFSRETLNQQTQCMQATRPFPIRLPGLLMIDTPGHEAFSNLRNRGSSLCDIAILVVDLMHGLEPQTIESLKMLHSKHAHFVVALNKVDRLYGWRSLPDGPIEQALAMQDENCIAEFKMRSEAIIVQLMELGFNAKLYWENDSPLDTLSLVPTSAHSGEGVPDLLRLLIVDSQTHLEEKLMYVERLQCTVLEVKVLEGLGTSIDVVLVNGTLREGDRIVVSTMDGPVVTSVRALLTPPPNREMR